MKKTKPCQFKTFEPVPGVVVCGRVEDVEIRLIPALAAIAGSKTENSDPSNNIYLPPRGLCLSMNEDGTYAVFNRLELIEPDIARIAAKWVTACVIQFSPDQEEQESLLRTFLMTVEPARYCVTGPQLLYEIFKGKLNKLASLYASARCKPGGWGMYRELFSNNELPKATFYRHKSSPDGETSSSSSDSTEPESAVDDETPLPEIDEKPQHQKTKEQPSRSGDSTGSEPTIVDETRLPEVDKKPQRQKAEKQPKGNQRDFFDKLDEPD